MQKNSEVFKVACRKSVRGYVTDVTENDFTVDWVKTPCKDSVYMTSTYPLNALGKDVFETEKELIKSRGQEIEELAPPREIELKYANDFFNQHINEGDFVIAMAGDALYHKLEGIAKRIYMLSSVGMEKEAFLDIYNEEGKVVASRCNARMFSLPERFQEA